MCVCVCVYVCVGSGRSFKHVSSNNKDKFCLYNLFKILSSFLISVLVSGWNWPMKGSKALGKFIYQFQPETKTLIRKLERILNKLYRQNLSLSFNEIHTHTHTHTHTHIYIYIYIHIYIYNLILSKAKSDNGGEDSVLGSYFFNIHVFQNPQESSKESNKLKFRANNSI